VRNETATGTHGRSADVNRCVTVEPGEIREILTQIVAEILSKGAWLNPDLRIVASDSGFGIQCVRSALVNKLLIKVPAKCLLPIHQFEMSYQDGTIQLIRGGGKVTKTRRRLMELTIAFYNASGKVESFASNSPEITLGRDHPLTLRLGSGNGFADPSGTRPATPSKALDDNTLKLEQFLGSRTYGTRFGSLRSVLIPILDLINHHPMGAGFNEGAAGKFISVDVNHPLQESAECWVNYGNNKDTLDFFRYFHFVPLHVPHVFSIPTVLSPTSSSFIYINRGYREHPFGESHFIKKLPPRLTLENNIVSCENIRISELVKHDSLGVGIDFMVKMLGKSMGFTVTQDMIRETRFNLLEVNRNFYSGLIKLASSEPVTPRNRELLDNIVLMSERQLTLLNSYASKKGLH
jgi:hypothetical protein